MKICSLCNEEKALSEYSLHSPKTNNTKLRPDCKSCVRERARKKYSEDPDKFKARMKLINSASVPRAREYIYDYLKTHPCVDCGEPDPIVLEFDHVRGKKYSNISALMGKGARLWRIENEISKCEVRCANCHRRVTAHRDGWYKIAGKLGEGATSSLPS